MTRALAFTKAGICRAVDAFIDSLRRHGLSVNDVGVSVHPDGTITVHQTCAAIALPSLMPQHAGASEWEDIGA
jgi:hypothetical protein